MFHALEISVKRFATTCLPIEYLINRRIKGVICIIKVDVYLPSLGQLAAYSAE